MCINKFFKFFFTEGIATIVDRSYRVDETHVLTVMSIAINFYKYGYDRSNSF